MNPSMPNQPNQPAAPGGQQYPANGTRTPQPIPQPQGPHYGGQGSIDPNTFARDAAAPPQLMQPPVSAGAPAGAPLVRSNPNSTQNTLQIAEIRDGIVIMSD